jgi:hypothetical protein
MMVPAMLADLIEIVRGVDPNATNILDPFAGSGTVQTETMLKGANFHGFDINPLAVLLCKAKAGPFCPDRIEEAIEDTLATVEDDPSTKREASFEGLQKWFEPQVTISLSRIRRAIRGESSLYARRFLWVALAEVVRLVSNSRTSTYKLHIRQLADIHKRSGIRVEQVFEEILWRNLQSLREITEELNNASFLRRGWYKGVISVELADAKTLTLEKRCDLLVTSPPYGDNHTTVPYGQSSFLPLQWIDSVDIDSRIDCALYQNTHSLDTASLGGSRRGASEKIETLIEKSPTFARFLEASSSTTFEHQKRLASFLGDFDTVLDRITKSLRKDAYMIWVVGNRRVGGRVVPFDRILCDLLERRGAIEVLKIDRTIPVGAKRMAVKNGITKTMTREVILVYRNARVL